MSDSEPQCCAWLLYQVHVGISDEKMRAHLAACEDCKAIRGEQ